MVRIDFKVNKQHNIQYMSIYNLKIYCHYLIFYFIIIYFHDLLCNYNLQLV